MLRLFGSRRVSCATLSSVRFASARVRGSAQAAADDLSYQLRALLVRNPDCAIPKLSSLLSESAIDAIELVPGGLLGFLRARPETYEVRTDSSTGTIHVSLTRSARTPQSMELITVVRRIVRSDPHAHVTGGVPLATIARQLSESERSLLAQSYNGSLADFVRRSPSYFQLSSDGKRVSLAPSVEKGVANVLPIAPEQTSAANVAAPVAALHKGVASALRTTLPHGFFVPLSAALKQTRVRNCFHRGEVPSLAEAEDLVREIVSSAAPSLIEVQVIEPDAQLSGGDAAPAPGAHDRVFLRVAQSERVELRHDEIGEQAHAAFSPLAVLPALERDFAAAAAQSPDPSSFAIYMVDLPSVLRPETLQALPLRGRAAILVFDRLRHRFDVDVNEGVVRLRQPHEACELALQTTPAPRAVRHALSVLRQPVSCAELMNRLPPSVAREALACFGTARDFVRAHPVYMMLRPASSSSAFAAAAPAAAAGDGSGDAAPEMVWTPQLIASEVRASNAVEVLSERQLAARIYQVLPESHPVVWATFRTTYHARQNLPPAAHDVNISFFERFGEFFTLFDAVGVSVPVVGRRDCPRLPFPYVHEPCETLDDALRQIALVSSGGAGEGTIMLSMSREARAMVRALGGFERLVRQLPQWFEVRNEHQRQGESFCTYIGHLRNAKQR